VVEKKSKTYAQLSAELADLIAWFESDQVDLDSAIAKYDKAVKLIEQMEKHLSLAENKIKKISADLT
jgi:exodeoxyribonuclease VII small subunit